MGDCLPPPWITSCGCDQRNDVARAITRIRLKPGKNRKQLAQSIDSMLAFAGIDHLHKLSVLYGYGYAEKEHRVIPRARIAVFTILLNTCVPVAASQFHATARVKECLQPAR